MGAEEALKSFASIAVVFIIIYFLWYILWKLAFEPNPLVRDFFDLDSNKARNQSSQSLEESRKKQ